MFVRTDRAGSRGAFVGSRVDRFALFAIHLLLLAVLLPASSQAVASVAAPDRNPSRVALARLMATPPPLGQMQLENQSLSLRLSNTDHGAKLRAGSSAFVNVDVSNSGTKRSKPAELLFTGHGARLVRVQGKGVRARRAGDGRVIMLGRLPANGERSLVLEFRLDGADDDTAGSTSIATADLALQLGRPIAKPTSRTRLRWSILNPARDYHRALRKLDAENGEEIYASISEARKGLTTLPGTWLFKPTAGRQKKTYKTIRKTINQRYCARYRRATRAERRRARRRGRRAQRKCVRRATRKVTRSVRVAVKRAADPLAKDERELFRLAGNAVKGRGGLPALRKTGGRFGWISSRIAVDLRTYMGQPSHPALCTGMDVTMDYLHDNAISFRRRISETHRIRALAPTLAANRVRALRRMLNALPGGHPASGAAPLAILTPFPEDADVLMSLEQMAGHVVSLVAGAGTGADVASTGFVMDSLELAADALRSAEFKTQPDAIQRAARRALSTIEAGYYIGLSDRAYSRIETALFGGISNVRAAHEQHCVTSS